ncbi:MAG: alpha/beta hydrolase family protein [Pyrinomonadaceae bacterium]
MMINDNVLTVDLVSNLNRRTLPYKAILPPGYADGGRKFPVLYLLHGLFGSFENWVANTGIVGYARKHSFLIVCPEGGDNWYSDNPNRPHSFFESYFFRELIPDVEERFDVRRDRPNRAVGGLSMGGYAAFKFAFRRPEMFALAVSMSGAFDIVSFLKNENDQWAELQPSIEEAFGGRSAELLTRDDLFHLAENHPEEKIAGLPRFYFDCGRDDSFLPINRRFSAGLKRRGIVHRFREFDGGHDWDYWDRRIEPVLEIISEVFEKPAD